MCIKYGFRHEMESLSVVELIVTYIVIVACDYSQLPNLMQHAHVLMYNSYVYLPCMMKLVLQATGTSLRTCICF